MRGAVISVRASKAVNGRPRCCARFVSARWMRWWEGAKRTWTMSLLTLDSLKKMLFGELSVKT